MINCSGRFIFKSIEKYKCKHYPQGKILSVEEFLFDSNHNNPIGVYSKKFDSLQSIIEEKYYNGEGKLLIETEYEYDLLDCFAIERTVIIDNKQDSITKYRFLPGEKLIEEYIINECVGCKIFVYQLDSKNRTVGKHQQTNSKHKEVVMYDTNNRITIYLKTNGIGILVSKDILAYGSHEEYECLETLNYPGSILQSKVENSYVFDYQGNWIEKNSSTSVYKSGKIVARNKHVTKRLIVYRDCI